MPIEVVSVGNELLWGYTVNSNAAYISRELAKEGYAVVRHTTVSDRPEAIEAALKEALHRSSLVIATGGLGPTLDDLTRSVATSLFSTYGEELPNRLGTAPGLFFFTKGKGLVLLPGVPSEMEEMLASQAMPRITAHFPLKKKLHIRRCTLCLLRELEVDPFLRQEKEAHPEVEIGLFPSLGSLQVVFQSEKSVEAMAHRLQKKFPAFYVGEGRVEEALHRELSERKRTLALAESITGGAIAARLTAVPGASEFLLGSMVVYSNSWKERFLQVSHTTIQQKGAVSAEAAEEMIKGLFSETDAEYAIAVTGIAGPTGATKEKPLGTVYIAIGQRGKKIDCGRIQGPQDRASCIELTVQTAFGALWRRIAHNTFTLS